MIKLRSLQLLILSIVVLCSISPFITADVQDGDIILILPDTYIKTVRPKSKQTYNFTLKNMNSTVTYEILVTTKSSVGGDWTIDVTPNWTALMIKGSPKSIRNITLTVTAPDKEYGTIEVEIYISVLFNKLPYTTLTVRTITTIESIPNLLGIFENPLPELINTKWKMFIADIILWVLIAICVVLLLDKVLHWATRKTKTEVDDIILDIIRTPLIVIISIYGIVSSLRVLDLSETLLDWIENIYYIVLVFVGVWIIYRILRDVVIYYGKIYAEKTQTQIDDILVPIAEKVGIVILAIVGIALVLSHVGVDLTVLALGSVVIGMVVAFALQDTLSNFFSGIYILADRPFKVGDLIVLPEGECCRIVHIGMRSTRLYNIHEHTEIIMPNNKLANEKVVNYTEPDERFRVKVEVGVAYGSDVDKVKSILLDVAKNHPEVVKEKGYEPVVRYVAFGESSLNFNLLAWIKNVEERFNVITDLHTEIDKRFREEKIEIPFPQRVLHVKGKLI